MEYDDGERARWTVELNLRTVSIRAAAVLGVLGVGDLVALGVKAAADPTAPATLPLQLAVGVGIGVSVMAVVILGVAIYTRVMSARLDAFAATMRAEMEAHHRAFVGEARSFQAGVVTTVDTLKDAIPLPPSNVIPFPTSNRDYADAN